MHNIKYQIFKFFNSNCVYSVLHPLVRKLIRYQVSSLYTISDSIFLKIVTKYKNSNQIFT